MGIFILYLRTILNAKKSTETKTFIKLKTKISHICASLAVIISKKTHPMIKKYKNPAKITHLPSRILKVWNKKCKFQKTSASRFLTEKLKTFPVFNISFKTTVTLPENFIDFRLWINENLIKDDLETLREASKRNTE